MRTPLIIALFFLVSTKTFAYNFFETQVDKKLISAVIKLDKNNPKEIEEYFKKQRIQKIDTTKEFLGFGWKMWTPSIGGSYISISVKFFYFNDSLVSYSLIPQLPKKKALQKRYEKWYDNYFSFSNSEMQPFNFNQTAILKPLNQYIGSLKNIPGKIATYMSPNSGTMYGLIDNRKAFLGIKDSLTNDQLILLMYSINPASRFTAIDYYLKHKERFLQQQQIDEWIDIVFSETPKVKTMSGCFLVTEPTETLFPRHYIDKYNRQYKAL